MAKVLGIDLGTTNSCMAIVENGKPVVLENSEGGRTTPSVVAFTKAGDVLVGQAAKRQAATNPKNTIYSAKRLIGRKFSELTEEDKRLPYTLRAADNGDVCIEVEEDGEKKLYSPQEIGAKILSKLKMDAEAKLGEPVTQAVITVPAYFNDAQRKATKVAGEIAGLEVLRIVNEPTAAALAYGVGKQNKDHKIVVYDLGGGTFDVSVLDIDNGTFQVLATDGDTHLGGDDWDNAVMEWLFKEFKAKEGIDISKQNDAVQRVKEEAEKAKIALSSATSYDISLPFIAMDSNGPKHLQVTLTRQKLDELTADLLERTVKPVDNALKDAKVFGDDTMLPDAQNDKFGGIAELVLVGGMTRNPAVQEKARRMAGKEPFKGVNPDEVVAMGAAVQGDVIVSEDSENGLLLLDVTPLTLGIRLVNDRVGEMVPANTTIPTNITKTFTTCSDFQSSVEICVGQGESKSYSGLKELGKFTLNGIELARCGVPKIDVTFDMDANGILKVTAKDQKTGETKDITIKGGSGMSDEEVERAKREEAARTEKERNKNNKAEAVATAESVIAEAERAFAADGVDDDLRVKGENAISELREALKGDDVERIKSLTASLRELIDKSDKVHNSRANANGDSSSSSKADDDVIVIGPSTEG